MKWNFSQISSLFTKDESKLLLDGKWGIERESQRITPAGDLALTEHPSAFGNKLENTLVTTDFSESQLELITPPLDSVEKTHEFLKELQHQVEKELNNELLWPFSMPPRLPEEQDIPIAKFEPSTEGKEKEIYRTGLALRYGKKMQMISGIHYNFSFGDEMIGFLYQKFGNGQEKRSFMDELYFKLARNFLRYRWLLIYLFGASPAIDPTYYSVVKDELKIVAQCCPECCNPMEDIERYATSLRVSRFGYSSSVQGKHSVSYNSLEKYIQGISTLLSTKNRKFKRLGLYKDGRQVQLNDNILQKESEFYSSFRLKQITGKGETQLEALEKRGVKYAEVRILDINPFEKTGISQNQLYFLQAFMLFCLFEKSDPIQDEELEKINTNHHLVALSGRKQNLRLYKYDRATVSLAEWANQIFEKIEFIATLMDKSLNSSKYMTCIEQEHKKIADMSLLPSAQINKEMKEQKEGYLEYGLNKAVEHKNKDSSVAYI